MVRRVGELRSLGPGGVVLLARVAARLALVRRFLRREGLRGTLARTGGADLLARGGQHADDGPAVLSADAARLVRLVRFAGPRCRATCLPQAIVLAEELRRKGLDAGLRIGVARAEGASTSGARTGWVRAHAWVELEGRPVAEDPGEYSAFDGADLERVVRALLGRERSDGRSELPSVP